MIGIFSKKQPSVSTGVGTSIMFNTVISMAEGISSNNVGELRNTMSHSLRHEVILPEVVWRI